MNTFQDVLDFWFGKSDSDNYGKPRKEWFIKKPKFDEKVRSRFQGTYYKAAAGELDHWRESPHSCLALIIVLDQFPRNLFRGQPEAFATDEKALQMARYAIAHSYDYELLPVERWFIYLPFEHSERLEDQYQAIALFLTLKNDPDSTDTIDYAFKHLRVIEQFGRFPHRNQILGRESTPEEEEFLKQPDSSF